MEGDVNVDGVLSEAEWQSAGRVSGFSQYLPADGRPAEDSTTVLVWYSPYAIYFGIRAYAPPGAVRATLADRDKIEGDDYVRLLVDTFNDQRQTYVFSVNPLGVQADGTLRDAAQRTSLLQASGSTTFTLDLSPDYVYESKGRVTDKGYEVEVRVPFKSLRYQPDEVQTWGFNVIRKVQHSGYVDTWTQVLKDNASFLGQSGKLEGLQGLRRGLVLDVTPETTYGVVGSPDVDKWQYTGQRVEVGGTVRWGITNNLTLNATANPDFSQIEADAARIQYDPREEIFITEKRPFFLDGIELFSSPTRLVYTRRMVQPVGAAKVTGKIKNTNVAFLSAADAQSVSPTGDTPFFNILRLRQDLSRQSTLGLVYTDKIVGSDFNRVVAADGRVVIGKLYDLTLQGGASVTKSGGESRSAPMWAMRFDRNGRAFGFNLSARGYHPDFQAQSGFLGRTAIARANFTPRYTIYGEEGGLVETWTGSVSLDGIWKYRRFTEAKLPDDARLHLNSGWRFRGGWSFSHSVLRESFRFDESLFTNHYVERQENGVAVDTVKFVGQNRIPNLDFLFTFATPRFQKFGGNILFVIGPDTDFFEWTQTKSTMLIFLNMDWRPTQKLRFDIDYTHQQYFRQSDGSTSFRRMIPRFKVEYQLTRALFIRLVAEYQAFLLDASRDALNNGDPILFFDPGTGDFVRSVRRTSNDFRVDWLISYRPTPGTVAFFGYGSSMTEPASFRFRQLERLNDGFFLKLSYLIRS
ncbi:MAG: DUF5916 domain-containing protein [Bacteroidota bacterium]